MSFDFERPERQPQALPFDEFLPTNASPADEATKIPWSELEPIGAYDKCYLFFDAGEQLLVVDQHAFHERIVFERLLKDRQILRRTQALLVPESLVLRHGEIETLKARAQELAAVGFTLQFASETTVDVLGVPAILAGRDIDSVMTTLARPEETSIPTEDAGGLAQDILATIACHSAVRAGESLGESELKQLLREASAVDFYHNCPHGRRVFKWWKRTEVARWFDR